MTELVPPPSPLSAPVAGGQEVKIGTDFSSLAVQCRTSWSQLIQFTFLRALKTMYFKVV